MRYLEEITFVTEKNSYYDPELGEYVPGEIVRLGTSANVTDLGTDRSAEVFGDIKQGAKVIRLQPLFDIPDIWGYIEIDGKPYELTTDRQPIGRHTLIVQEVTVDGKK